MFLPSQCCSTFTWWEGLHGPSSIVFSVQFMSEEYSIFLLTHFFLHWLHYLYPLLFLALFGGILFPHISSFSLVQFNTSVVLELSSTEKLETLLTVFLLFLFHIQCHTMLAPFLSSTSFQRVETFIDVDPKKDTFRIDIQFHWSGSLCERKSFSIDSKDDVA